MWRERETKREPSIKISVGIIIAQEGKLILVRQTKNQKWGIPAGKVEYKESDKVFESFIEALEREVAEETGRRLNAFDQVGGVTIAGITCLPGYSAKDKKNRMGIAFFANLKSRCVVDEHSNFMAPEGQAEIDRFGLFSVEELQALLDNPQDTIYRPEFNYPAIDWFIKNHSIIEKGQIPPSFLWGRFD